jgi:hypothetical protein
MILQAMAEKDTGQRKLALKTGISKTRLALILHHDPAKRAAMTLVEFQTVLHALDINIIQAIIRVEAFRDQELLHDARYATLIAMLSEMFRGLPSMLVAALEEIEGMDGSEVRREWAGPLQAAVVQRLVKEVSSVLVRRADLPPPSGPIGVLVD